MDRTILLSLLITCISLTSAQIPGGAENIGNLTDPAVVAAANAGVQYLNRQNPPDSRELILVRIISGTQQVVNGIRYRLNIEVATAQTCLNDNTTSTIDQCPVDINSTNYWMIVVVSSTGPPVMQTVESATMVLLGGRISISDFSDPRVVGAACAAVDQITAINNSIYKSVLVSITNGTYQVVNGLKFDLLIVVALSTTCERDSELCTSTDCPIDESTRYLWMASVVAPPTPVNMTINYTVLNVSRIMRIGQPEVGAKMPLQNFSDPKVMGAACAAVDQITEMSTFEYKSVLVTIISGTFQVVEGLRYDMLIEVALSTTCARDSNLCTSVECPIDVRTQMQWMVSVVAPPTPPSERINYDVLSVTPVIDGGGGMKIPLQNFSDPKVMGAACAAVDQITEMSNSEYKSVLVTIISGTFQVVEGLRYDMLIEVALSTTCARDSNLCTSVECPIDVRTQMQWMVSVVAPPGTINYDVLSVTPVIEDSGGIAIMTHGLFTIAAPIIFIVYSFSI